MAGTRYGNTALDIRKRFARNPGDARQQRVVVFLSALGVFIAGLISWAQPSYATMYFPFYGSERTVEFYRQLGVSLSTAGVLSLSYEMLLRRGTERYISARLYDLISTMNNTSAQATSAGVSGILMRRNTEYLAWLLTEAKSEFLCLGISLPDICNATMADRISEQLQRSPALRVRILLLSPFSAAAILKDQFGVYHDKPAMYLPEQIMGSALTLTSLAHQLGGDSTRLEARFYWSPPTLSVVMNERFADVAPYDEVGAANLAPTLRVERSDEGRSVLYSRYRSHFDTIWSAPRTVDILNGDVTSSLAKQLHTESEIAGIARKFFKSHSSRLVGKD